MVLTRNTNYQHVRCLADRFAIECVSHTDCIQTVEGLLRNHQTPPVTDGPSDASQDPAETPPRPSTPRPRSFCRKRSLPSRQTSISNRSTDGQARTNIPISIPVQQPRATESHAESHSLSDRYGREREMFKARLCHMAKTSDWKPWRRQAHTWPSANNERVIGVLLGSSWQIDMGCLPGIDVVDVANRYINMSSELCPLKLLQPFTEVIGLSILLCLPQVSVQSDRQRDRRLRAVKWLHTFIGSLHKAGFGHRATEAIILCKCRCAIRRID